MKIKAHLLCAVALAAAAATPAFASGYIEGRTVNPSCKLEAEANCNWGDLRKAKAKGMDLHDSTFLSAWLDEGDFEGVNFTFAQMQLTSMKKANFKRAVFTSSHMHAIKAQGANFEGANLDNTNLTSAYLEGANLKGASIKNVLWMNARLTGATWVDGRICAEGSVGECK